MFCHAVWYVFFVLYCTVLFCSCLEQMKIIIIKRKRIYTPFHSQGAWCISVDVNRRISIMASQTTYNSTFCSTTCSGWQQEKHLSTESLDLWESNPPLDSTHKRARNADGVSISYRHHMSAIVGRCCHRWHTVNQPPDGVKICVVRGKLISNSKICYNKPKGHNFVTGQSYMN